jgi:hypothetical protein
MRSQRERSQRWRRTRESRGNEDIFVNENVKKKSERRWKYNGESL